MEMQRKTLSFLTGSKASAVGGICVRRVAMALLVMLLATVSAWAQSIAPTTYELTLNYNYEGGGRGVVNVPTSNPTYTLTSYDEPTHNGCQFLGWSKKSTGEVEYHTGDEVTLSGNLTLYAVWDDTPLNYTPKYSIISESERKVELTGYEGANPTGTLDIPANVTIDGKEYSVTSIGDYAFGGCFAFTSVTIPNGVTSIGDGAFQECLDLESVTIPNSVTSIGDCAFQECLSLESITIPNSVTSIGDCAFKGCSSLKSLTIPNSVTSIGEEAFEACDELESLILNGNPKIGINAFNGIPATVTMNLTASNVGGEYWTTFFNYDYNFQPDVNTTVYKGTVNESTLVLTEVADKIVNRYTAVILKSSGNPIVLTLVDEDSNDTNGNALQGWPYREELEFVKSEFCADAIYTLGNTSAGFGFHKYTGEYFPGGKAFLPLYTSNGAKSLTIVFANETTGIKPLSPDDNALQNDWFSLDGTRLNGKPSQHGIYVNGNKKIVIK